MKKETKMNNNKHHNFNSLLHNMNKIKVIIKLNNNMMNHNYQHLDQMMSLQIINHKISCFIHQMQN